MISVVIADYLQFVVLSFGLLLTCFMAVRKLGGDSHKPLLGIMGPPGTGRTSLASTVASILGLQFVIQKILLKQMCFSSLVAVLRISKVQLIQKRSFSKCEVLESSSHWIPEFSLTSRVEQGSGPIVKTCSLRRVELLRSLVRVFFSIV
jgi:Holliday junction resolvasome RuvABC ATP-dependent DNA helicase subunit